MAKKKESKAAAPKTAQNAEKAQEMALDAQPQGAALDGGQEAPEGRGESIDPEDETTLLGCQEDEAELEETEFIEYAVAGCKRLNLREEPSLDAPIVAELPCGVGVLGNTRPDEGGWRQVFTGRLFGWVRDEFLEPLELPETDDGAE